MKELEAVKEKALYVVENNNWIKWVHEGTDVAVNNSQKIANISLSTLLLGKHCSICLNLNGCCFPEYNMPKIPLHQNCHCKSEPVFRIQTKAECLPEKFTKYIFGNDENISKKALFESWGYDIIDSNWLKEEFVRQAQKKYAKGDFVLGKLDAFGQRINIRIILPRKDKIGTIDFVSGWMVYPNGKIKLTTPYGGN